jgi:AraC-like DNA-binding protein
VTERETSGVAGCGERASAKAFETITDFALMCRRPSCNLLSDSKSFSVGKRSAPMGPVALSEYVVDSDLSIDFGERAPTYWVHMLLSGHAQSVHKGQAISADAGSACVYTPEESGVARWAAGTRMICLEIDSRIVDDARCDALGGIVTPRSDLPPVMATSEEPARSWTSMMLHFQAQLFRPNSLLSQPLVGLPFADALVRGFLFAADQRYRQAIAEPAKQAVPDHIRTAIEIIEAEAHLPLTVSRLAARCHISVRALQEGFRRHLGTSPMAHLREVRLRRAHQTLLASDPATVTVTEVAIRWGFTNLGRFTTAHTARYNESPVATLHRV